MKRKEMKQKPEDWNKKRRKKMNINGKERS